MLPNHIPGETAYAIVNKNSLFNNAGIFTADGCAIYKALQTAYNKSKNCTDC